MAEIRDFQPADFETLYEIDQVCFPRGVAYSRPVLREFLDAPESRCLVAVAGPSVLGFILTHRQDDQGHIVTLDVLPDHRRAGTGSLLLQAAEKDLVARGVRSIVLETATRNDPAVAFWKRHGYVSLGTMENYYGRRGGDAFLMHKQVFKTGAGSPT